MLCGIKHARIQRYRMWKHAGIVKITRQNVNWVTWECGRERISNGGKRNWWRHHGSKWCNLRENLCQPEVSTLFLLATALLLRNMLSKIQKNNIFCLNGVNKYFSNTNLTVILISR